MSELTDFWQASYRKKRGCTYKFLKRDGIILHNLVHEYEKLGGEKLVRALIGKFLALEDEPSVRRSGWDTRQFAYRFRGLYVEHVRAYGEQAVLEANEKRQAVQGIRDERVLVLVDSVGKGTNR